MAWDILPISIVWSTVGADSHRELPACDAEIVHVPPARNVTVPPASEQTVPEPDVTVTTTGRPTDETAEGAYVPPVTGRDGISVVNPTVWAPLVTVTVRAGLVVAV
jgi:hypothetical protein